LSKNYIVAFLLATVAGAAFVGDSLATNAVIKYTALADREKLKTFATCVFPILVSAGVVLIRFFLASGSLPPLVLIFSSPSPSSTS